MKRILSIMMVLIMMASLVSCLKKEVKLGDGSEVAEVVEAAEISEENASRELSETSALEALENLEVEKGLFTVEITIPAEYVEGTSQEELDASAEENGIESITLNEDGSATYIMTKEKHQEMMDEMKASFDQSMEEMKNAEEYPNIASIETNDNYSEFNIVIKSEELTMIESMTAIIFYMYGNMYNVFNGTPIDDVHVIFINEASGEIISELNSDEFENNMESLMEGMLEFDKE